MLTACSPALIWHGHGGTIRNICSLLRCICHCRQGSEGKKSGRMQSLAGPLHLAGQELLPTLFKLGSAVSLDSARTATLRHLGTRFLTHQARHQAALRVLARCGAGRGAACAVKQRAAAEVRQNRVT